MFADLYLDALAAALAGNKPARPWDIAFGAPVSLPALRHVLLGMNAHINYDLPQALVAVITGEQFDDPVLVIDQIGRVLCQHELPAVRGRHRIGRPVRLLEPVEQRRQIPHGASARAGPVSAAPSGAPNPQGRTVCRQRTGRGFAMDNVMFLDCPEYMDRHGAARCGLPAAVEYRYTMQSTDGPLESVRIRCPRGHCLNGPLESLTWEKNAYAPPGGVGIRDQGAAARGDGSH